MAIKYPGLWYQQSMDERFKKAVFSGIEKYDLNYGLEPNYGCCLANMHQGWPKFIESMWMATNDNGLALVSYGPSIVKAKVAKGTEVTITEKTEYPFKGLVNLTINTPKNVIFPIYLRIPGWADSVIIKFKNKSIVATGGSTFKMLEKWKNGDQIAIEMPMDIRFKRGITTQYQYFADLCIFL
jgi:uncharacterized protein